MQASYVMEKNVEEGRVREEFGRIIGELESRINSSVSKCN